MIRLLGRATSGNVQKVIFLLEEMGVPYEREDFGRQFNNTGGDYLKLNPTGKVPTIVDGETVPIKAGDAIPVDLGQVHSFTQSGGEPLELLVIGVAKDMAAKQAFMAIPPVFPERGGRGRGGR